MAHVSMHHPTPRLKAYQLSLEAKTILQAQPLKATFPNHPHLKANLDSTQTLKVQKVSPAEMVECRKKGIFYYCDENYSLGHKCRKEKFFYIDASTSSSYANIPSDETPNLEDAQPSVHVEDFVADLV
jgi:hypothetical protein